MQLNIPCLWHTIKKRRSKITRAISRHLFLTFLFLVLFGRLRCIWTFNYRIDLKNKFWECGLHQSFSGQGQVADFRGNDENLRVPRNRDKWQIFVKTFEFHETGTSGRFSWKPSSSTKQGQVADFRENLRFPRNSDNSFTGSVTTDFSHGTVPHRICYRKVKATFIGFLTTGSFKADEWIFASPRRPARFGRPNILPMVTYGLLIGDLYFFTL